MTDLSGKVAFVTGAGSGIGTRIAIGLAARGAYVGVSGLALDAASATASRITATGGRAASFAADVADESAVRAAILGTVDAFGALDMAVNNAGVPSSNQSLMSMTLAEWQAILAVDLTGVFLSLKHEIAAMTAKGQGGSIVNIASGGGMFAIPHSPAYVASKHGVVGLTKSAAVDYAAAGIRVNALAPGMIGTDKLYEIAAGTPMVDTHIAMTPLGRLGKPDEVADAAAWLCSDEASYITGTVLTVDGGRRA